MKRNDGVNDKRREFLRAAGTAATGLALGALPFVAAAQGAGLKIGVIGSGRIGGTLGGIWVKSGHEVMFSSLDLEHDKALAARLGGKARAKKHRRENRLGENREVSHENLLGRGATAESAATLLPLHVS